MELKYFFRRDLYLLKKILLIDKYLMIKKRLIRRIKEINQLTL